MSWPSVLAMGICLAIVVCGCWLMDRAGTSGATASGGSSTDDGVASLSIIATAMATHDASSPDAASSDASSSEM